MRSLGILFALGLITCSSARSLPIRHYESKIVPLGIAQNRDGFLWIATADGLMRFDGLHYEAVRSPGARDVDVSPDGSVWLATHDGVVRYKRGVFTREITGHAITALIVTHAGQLLAATDKDLYIAVNLDKEPLKWSLYRDASVHGRFQADLEGNIWFGCGLKLCEWSDDDIRAVAGGADWHKYRKPPPNHIGAIKDQQRDWADIVGTPEHRIWARNGPEVIEFNGAETIRRDVPVETFKGVRPGFLLDHVGRLWIPGRRLHVVENGRIEVFQPGGAPLEDVTTVFEDRRGTLWFGLAGKGLAALPAQTMLESWGESEGIAGSVLDLAVSPRGGLLAAGYSGGYVLDAKGGRWHRLSGEHGALRATLAEAGGSILQIPFAGGLLRDGREIPLPEGFNRKRMRYLYRDPKGTVWIASIDGLFRLDGRITRVPLPANKLYPSDMIADADGRLWMGYEDGVAVCAEGNCTQAIAPGDGLASPKIRTIAVSPNAVWVGYRPSIGFTRFRRKPGGWAATQFPPEKGYGPVDTHFLRRDRRGWIWRGSTDGVYICDGVHMEPEDWLHL